MLKALSIATLFSSFIYLEYLFGSNIYIKLINTISIVVSICYILKFSRREFGYFGFFVGVLWFYWISLSFRYYELSYLIPIVIISIGLIYAFIFYIFSFARDPLFRAILLPIYLHLFEPFGFNWLKIEFTFVETIFNYHLSSYVVILTIGFLSILKDKKLIALTIISSITLLSYFELFTHQEIKNEEFRIKILHTDIKQDDKWRSDKLNEIINYNLDLIDSAKDVDLIVLPESTFPLFLNEEPILIDILKEKSQDRAILLGSLRSDDKHNLYNSTYLFYDGEMITADKVVLVPFGEVIPLPKFISKFINELFFNGAEDYKVADDASNFDIDNFSFRPLICFEGTIERFYKDAPDNIILISNNAWFTPSIEPTLQKIILKYYAKKYNKRIFHSING